MKIRLDADKAWQAVLKYRERFDKTGIFECELYEGVADTIRKLKEAGRVIALASSKPGDSVQTYSGTFSLTPYFDEIVGSTLDGSISTQTAGTRGAWQTDGAYADHKRPGCA